MWKCFHQFNILLHTQQRCTSRPTLSFTFLSFSPQNYEIVNHFLLTSRRHCLTNLHQQSLLAKIWNQQVTQYLLNYWQSHSDAESSPGKHLWQLLCTYRRNSALLIAAYNETLWVCDVVIVWALNSTMHKSNYGHTLAFFTWHGLCRCQYQPVHHSCE